MAGKSERVWKESPPARVDLSGVGLHVAGGRGGGAGRGVSARWRTRAVPGAGGLFPLMFLNMFIVFPHPLAFVSRVPATVVPGLCSGKKK